MNFWKWLDFQKLMPEEFLMSFREDKGFPDRTGSHGREEAATPGESAIPPSEEGREQGASAPGLRGRGAQHGVAPR